MINTTTKELAIAYFNGGNAQGFNDEQIKEALAVIKEFVKEDN